MKAAILLLILPCCLFAETDVSLYMAIVNEYIRPGNGVACDYDPDTNIFRIVSWPKDGPPEPSLEDLAALVPTYRAWVQERVERASRKDAVRELAILKLMRSEDLSAVTTAEVEAAEEKLIEEKRSP